MKEIKTDGNVRVIKDHHGEYIVQICYTYCWKRYGAYKTERGALACMERIAPHYNR